MNADKLNEEAMALYLEFVRAVAQGDVVAVGGKGFCTSYVEGGGGGRIEVGANTRYALIPIGRAE